MWEDLTRKVVAESYECPVPGLPRRKVRQAKIAARLDECLHTYAKEQYPRHLAWERIDPAQTPTGRAILAARPRRQQQFIERLVVQLSGRSATHYADEYRVLLSRLMKRRPEFDQPTITRLVGYLAAYSGRVLYPLPTAVVVTLVERHLASNACGHDLQDALIELRRLYRVRADGHDHLNLLHRLERVTARYIPACSTNQLDHQSNPATQVYPFATQEAWVVALTRQIDNEQVNERRLWGLLLLHAETARQARPSAVWLQAAQTQVSALTADAFLRVVLPALSAVGQPGHFTVRTHSNGLREDTRRVHNQHSDLLRGLVWMTGLLPAETTARRLREVGVVCAEAPAQQLPRSLKICFATILALRMQMTADAATQLALLQTSVRQQSVKKRAQEAIDELRQQGRFDSVEPPACRAPELGFQQVGVFQRQVGAYVARIVVRGSGETYLEWRKPGNSTARRSPPLGVRGFENDAIGEMRKQFDLARREIPAQRLALERLYLTRHPITWQLLRDRLLRHPLVGPLARNLIWQSLTDDSPHEYIWQGDGLADIDGRPLPLMSDNTPFRLWHPCHAAVPAVGAWQRWIESQGICQPFAQAHRTAHPLPPTGVGADGSCDLRFAGHLVDERRMCQLVTARQWDCPHMQPRGPMTNPVLAIAAWNVRVEWRLALNKPIYDDQHQSVVPNTGELVWRSIDTREPVDAGHLPAQLVSEVMREVSDYFLQYGGLAHFATYRTTRCPGLLSYYDACALGQPTAAGVVRREFLRRQVPRLPIAARCRVGEQCVLVRGEYADYQVFYNSAMIRIGADGPVLHPPRTLLTPLKLGLPRKTIPVPLPYAGDLVLTDLVEFIWQLARDAQLGQCQLRDTIEAAIGRQNARTRRRP